MKSTELKNYMLADPFIRQYYGGVLARDQLPLKKTSKPKIYIINLDPIDQPGSHWISIFIDNKIAIYFDSLGKELSSDFKNFLIINGLQYVFNTKRIQNYNSKFCGEYCLCFSYFITRSYKFEEILDMFSNNLILNDILVEYFFQLTR